MQAIGDVALVGRLFSLKEKKIFFFTTIEHTKSQFGMDCVWCGERKESKGTFPYKTIEQTHNSSGDGGGGCLS